VLGAVLFFYPPVEQISALQYLYLSSYALLFVLTVKTIPLSIANKQLTVLFALAFGYNTLSTVLFIFLSWFLDSNLQNSLYLLNFSTMSCVISLVVFYLFLYTLFPKKESKRLLLGAFVLTAVVFFVAYYQVDFFADFVEMGEAFIYEQVNSVAIGSYYLQILNLMFFIFIWYNYFQGQFIFSEYLTSVLALFFLLILNEIYQLYYITELMITFDNALFINLIINLGLIFIWILRLNYLTSPGLRESEHYVLNYRILGKFMEKPHRTLWDRILVKMGKQKVITGSVFLFILVSIPILFLGSTTKLSRINIIILVAFMALVLIMGIINTQKRWYKTIGHLIHKEKNKSQ